VNTCQTNTGTLANNKINSLYQKRLCLFHTDTFAGTKLIFFEQRLVETFCMDIVHL
jgi:hypothetical protein